MMRKIYKTIRDDKRKYRNIVAMLIAVLIGGIIVSLCIGKYRIAIRDTVEVLLTAVFNPTAAKDATLGKFVLGIRFPRAIASIVVGAALSVAGAAYQGIFRNQLVSPDFLGVSTGACIGAAIAILLGLSSVFVQGFAFVSAIVAVALTVAISKAMKADSGIMLVLAGIIVSGLMSSGMAFIKYIADPQSELPAITYWQMGSLAYVKTADVFTILIPIAVGLAVLFSISWSINIVSLGEKEAKTLGVNMKRITNISIICATLLTASSVCISGTVGWVGLVIPHFSRLIVGPDNRKVVPVSALIGGLFLLVVDTFCRNMPIAEMPLSILTGLVGAPIYVILLYKQRMRII